MPKSKGPVIAGEAVAERHGRLPSLDRYLLSAAKGGSVILAGRLVTQASRVVFAIVLARFLAAEEYGRYNLSLTTVEVLAGLALLGLQSGLVRFVSACLSRGDRSGLWGVLQVCIGLTTGLGVFLAVLLHIFAGQVAQSVFHDPGLAGPLRLISVFLPVFALNDTLAAATRGFGNMRYTTVAQFVSHPLIKLVLLVLVAMTGVTSTRAVGVAGTAEVAVCFMLVYFLRKQLRAHPAVEAPRREMGPLLRHSLPLYFSRLLNEFGGRFQLLFLGTLSSTAEAGVFALARELSRLSLFFQRSVTMSSEPIISSLLTRNATREFASVLQNMTKWTFTLNFPLFLMLVLLPGPILSLFGASFVSGAAILWVMAFRRLAGIATGMCGVAVEMSGHTKLTLMNSIVRVVLLIVLNFLLIRRYGGLGAAIAVSVSEGADCMLLLIEAAVLFRILPFNASFLKPLAAGGVAAGAGLLFGQWLPPEQSVVNTAGSAFVILAFYIAGIFAMGLTREERLVLGRARHRAVTLFSRVPASETVR